MRSAISASPTTWPTGRGRTIRIGKNALVRQAFELAIDRAALVNVVFNGMYAPTVQAVPPSSPFFDRGAEGARRAMWQRRRRCCKQAGVTLPVKLELLAINDPDNLQAAEVIQSMAAEAGFDVHIQAIEFASSLQASARGDYQAYMIGWSGRVDIDGNTYQFLHSGQGNNASHYSQSDGGQAARRGARHDRPGEAARAVCADVAELRQDLPLTYLWNRAQHRRHVGEAERLPRRCPTA